MRIAAALTVALMTGVASASPLPFEVGGPFELVDQDGKTRTAESFEGKPFMLFFGYADCQSICTVAIPRMVETIDLLDADGVEVQPVLITVDPARDTPEKLAEYAPMIHERLIALTGSEEALAEARAAYRVEAEVIGEDILGPIYAHGSFIYLMGADGEPLSLLPPILGADQMAKIAKGRLSP